MKRDKRAQEKQKTKKHIGNSLTKKMADRLDEMLDEEVFNEYL